MSFQTASLSPLTYRKRQDEMVTGTVLRDGKKRALDPQSHREDQGFVNPCQIASTAPGFIDAARPEPLSSSPQQELGWRELLDVPSMQHGRPGGSGAHPAR